MDQSGFLFGSLIVGFLFWIILKGEAKTYLGFFTVSNATATASESGTVPQGTAPTGTTGSASSSSAWGMNNAPPGMASTLLANGSVQEQTGGNGDTGQGNNPLLNNSLINGIGHL